MFSKRLIPCALAALLTCPAAFAAPIEITAAAGGMDGEGREALIFETTFVSGADPVGLDVLNEGMLGPLLEGSAVFAVAADRPLEIEDLGMLPATGWSIRLADVAVLQGNWRSLDGAGTTADDGAALVLALLFGPRGTDGVDVPWRRLQVSPLALAGRTGAADADPIGITSTGNALPTAALAYYGAPIAR